jgi:hypothetical protein
MCRRAGRRNCWLVALYVIGSYSGHIWAEPASAEKMRLDVGGQVRERFESISHPGFGLAHDVSDDYLLHRLTIAASAIAGPHFDLNGEMVIAGVSGAAAPMAGTQDDPLDVLQLYADVKFEAGGAVRLRAGRQSLALGTARLVSMRDNTNVRRSFDGLRATWTQERVHVDAFYLQPVLPRASTFDDTRATGQSFWGLYLTRDAKQSGTSGADLYYLGLRNARASFSLKLAPELRHTVGARVFGAARAQDWNLEAAWQWGSFGASRIRAWTLSADVGYTLLALPLTPRLGLKADIISGDRNPHDATLGTFNPLFPKLNYFSDANVAVPANLFDVQPTLGLKVTDSLRVAGSWNVLWRYSRDDAFYLPPLQPVTTLSRAAGRYLGQQWSSTLEWQATASVDVRAGFVSFTPGSSLRCAGGASGRLIYASAQVHF